MLQARGVKMMEAYNSNARRRVRGPWPRPSCPVRGRGAASFVRDQQLAERPAAWRRPMHQGSRRPDLNKEALKMSLLN